MNRKIKCADCEYARQDKMASEYTKKSCKGCERNKNCVCGKKECKCGKGCKFKGTDDICPMQILLWKAVQCTNPDSEYHRSLLNVTVNGDKQTAITWSGCAEGVLA